MSPPPRDEFSQLIKFPEFYFPPDGSTNFTAQGFNAGQTAAAGIVVLGVYQLPQNERGVIRSGSVGVGNFTAAGAVVFQVRINGMPAPGFGEIFIPPQPAAFAALSFAPEETRIDVPAGALVQVTGLITAGGPFDMYSSWRGWHWGTL